MAIPGTAAHLASMSDETDDNRSARHPAGTRAGGRFASTRHPEADLALDRIPAGPPAAESREKRSAELNRRWHHRAHHGNDLERREAARAAVRRVFETGAAFTDVPAHDGHNDHIEAALADDAKLDQAIADVGALTPETERHWGDYLGGRLYDIETAEVAERDRQAALEYDEHTNGGVQP